MQALTSSDMQPVRLIDVILQISLNKLFNGFVHSSILKHVINQAVCQNCNLDTSGWCHSNLFTCTVVLFKSKCQFTQHLNTCTPLDAEGSEGCYLLWQPECPHASNLQGLFFSINFKSRCPCSNSDAFSCDDSTQGRNISTRLWHRQAVGSNKQKAHSVRNRSVAWSKIVCLQLSWKNCSGRKIVTSDEGKLTACANRLIFFSVCGIWSKQLVLHVTRSTLLKKNQHLVTQRYWIWTLDSFVKHTLVLHSQAFPLNLQDHKLSPWDGETIQERNATLTLATDSRNTLITTITIITNNMVASLTDMNRYGMEGCTFRQGTRNKTRSSRWLGWNTHLWCLE